MTNNHIISRYSADNVSIYFSKVSLIVIGLFIICPLLALPAIIVEVINRKRYANVLLCLFLGLCAILWAPTGDLYRHTLSYFNYTYANKFELSKFEYDFVLPIISYGFAKAGINFEFVRFLFVVISYLITFRFVNVIKDSNSFYQKHYLLLLTTLLFSVKFVSITFGLRYGFACQIFAWAYFLIYYQKKKIGWVVALFSGLIHYSLFFLLFILLINKIGIFKSKKIAFCGIPLLLLSTTNLLEKIIIALPMPDFVKIAVLSYATGFWSGEFLQNKSIYYRIGQILWNLGTYYSIFIFLSKKMNDSRNSLLAIMFFILCLLSSSTEFYYRILTAISFPFLFWVLSYCQKCRSVRILKIALICIVISWTSELYGVRQVIYESRYSELYLPVWVAMSNRYDLEWIQKNVNPSGSLSKYYPY